MKRILTLILSLTLAACLDTSAAIQQPANPSPTPQATATTSEHVRIVELPQCTVTADALHIRGGAGVTYSVIGYLKAGDIVTVQDQRGAWYDIGAGWVHSKYCKE